MLHFRCSWKDKKLNKKHQNDQVMMIWCEDWHTKPTDDREAVSLWENTIETSIDSNGVVS